MTTPNVNEVAKTLDRMEDTLNAGARLRTPKEILHDASDVQAKHPDKRIRWVSLTNPDKMISRQVDGYVRLSKEEGGRTIGDHKALFAIPRAAFEAKLARIQAETTRRVNMHKAQWEKFAENVARELHDRHGIDVDASRLIKTD